MTNVTRYFLVLLALQCVACSAGKESQNEEKGGTNGAVCTITDKLITALGPLLTKLGLASTVDGVKQLLLNLDDKVDGLLRTKDKGGAATQGITTFVSNLVKSLLGEPLDLNNIVGALVDVVVETLICVPTPLP